MNANLHSPEHMLQIEYIKHPQDYDMGSFHYHNAYELLFLQEGEYTLITMDTAYTICKNQVSLPSSLPVSTFLPLGLEAA